MKTIAITVEEEMLTRIDELATSSGRFSSRSALVRDALADYLARERRLVEEERERGLLRKHKRSLDRELEALVEEQARP